MAKLGHTWGDVKARPLQPAVDSSHKGLKQRVRIAVFDWIRRIAEDDTGDGVEGIVGSYGADVLLTGISRGYAG